MRRFLILLNLTELSFELGAGGWSGSTGGFRSGGGGGGGGGSSRAMFNQPIIVTHQLPQIETNFSPLNDTLVPLAHSAIGARGGRGGEGQRNRWRRCIRIRRNTSCFYAVNNRGGDGGFGGA